MHRFTSSRVQIATGIKIRYSYFVLLIPPSPPYQTWRSNTYTGRDRQKLAMRLLNRSLTRIDGRFLVFVKQTLLCSATYGIRAWQSEECVARCGGTPLKHWHWCLFVASYCRGVQIGKLLSLSFGWFNCSPFQHLSTINSVQRITHPRKSYDLVICSTSGLGISKIQCRWGSIENCQGKWPICRWFILC